MNKIIAVTVLYFCLMVSVFAEEKSCGFSISLGNNVSTKMQSVQLNDNSSLFLQQRLSTSIHNGSTIASNIICQKITGDSYTGSSKEWEQFFKSALSGLVKAGYENLSFTLVGQDSAIIKNTSLSKEYILKGTIHGNEQLIHNLALMSANKDSLLTVSISGNIAAKNMIVQKYLAIANEIKAQKIKL